MRWSHIMSYDLVKWAWLPTALKPDRPYDAANVYTGSATMVNGDPVLMYTAVADDGTSRPAVAVPVSRSDPMLVGGGPPLRPPVRPRLTSLAACLQSGPSHHIIRL